MAFFLSASSPSVAPSLARLAVAAALSAAALTCGHALAQGTAPATSAATPATTPTTTSTTASAAAAAVTTATGLVYQSLKDGTGAQPAAADTVKVHYRGTFPDGREFDSSYKRGQPAEFPLNRVIPCWTEGVQRMKVGGKAKLVCPPAIAYGSRGAGGVIPPDATLHFEVELLDLRQVR